MAITLDVADRAIIAALLEDGGLTYDRLGKLVGLSAPAVHDRVRKMRDRGILSAPRVEVNPDALGLHVLAFVFVRLDGGQPFAEVAAALDEMPAVVACHSTAGDFDVLLEVRATDTAMLEDILTELRRLGFVRDMQTRVVLRTYFENRPPLPYV